eukprot:100932_1
MSAVPPSKSNPSKHTTLNDNITLIDQIDAAIGRYYHCFNREYNAIFLKFCNAHEIDEDAIAIELKGDAANCILTEFDNNVPTPSKNENMKNVFIQHLIRKCWYNIVTNDVDNVFNLNWTHIASAINNELYKNISESLMNLINDNNISYLYISNDKIVNDVLNCIKIENFIDQNEIHYIKKLINRAIQFAAKIEFEEELLSFPPSCLEMEHMHINDSNVSRVLYDRHITHKCFTKYKLGQSGKVSVINGIDLCPEYIIDDNMFIIWRYLFYTFNLVNKIQHNSNNHTFTVKLFVIPNRVVSIYDENSEYKLPFKIDPDVISSYRYSDIIIAPSTDVEDISSLGKAIERKMEEKKYDTNNVVLIIDRTKSHKTHKDRIFIVSEELQKNLNGHYIMSLHFSITQLNKKPHCHLYYGVKGKNAKTIFHAQQLIKLIPRFFKRKNSISYIKYKKKCEDFFTKSLEFEQKTIVGRQRFQYDLQSEEVMKDIDNTFHGLNISMIYDIYIAHKCFMFINYQFAKFEKNDFIDIIEKNNYIIENNKELIKQMQTI